MKKPIYLLSVWYTSCAPGVNCSASIHKTVAYPLNEDARTEGMELSRVLRSGRITGNPSTGNPSVTTYAAAEEWTGFAGEIGTDMS
jgi:hypothetical protein